MIKLFTQPALKPKSCIWYQDCNTCQIGDESGSEQYDAGNEDQYGIQHLFCRELSAVQAFSDSRHSFYSLELGKICAQKAGHNDDKNRVEGPEVISDFYQQINLKEGNERESQEQS